MDAFITLTKTYERLGELEIINLRPPRPINRIPNTPKKLNISNNLNISTKIVKDADFSECVKELASNDLFLKMKNRAELEDLTPFAVYNTELIMCEVF